MIFINKQSMVIIFPYYHLTANVSKVSNFQMPYTKSTLCTLAYTIVVILEQLQNPLKRHRELCQNPVGNPGRTL